MIRIQEKKAVFHIPDSWPVVKYDACQLYQTRLRPMQATKGIDLMSCSSEALLLIEVKDDRGHPNPEKNWAETVAMQARHSLAGIVAGRVEDSDDAAFWRAAIELLHRSAGRGENNPVRIILLLLRDDPYRGELNIVMDRLKAKLRWLTPHVAVVGDQRSFESLAPGIQLEILPSS